MNKRTSFALLLAWLMAAPSAAQTDSTAVKTDTAVVAKKEKKQKKEKKEKAPKAKKQKTSKKNSKKGGDAEAAKAGLKAIINKHDTHMSDTVVSQVVEQFSNDPSVAVSAAHSYLWRKNGADVNQMQKYIDKALSYDPQYVPAYQLQAEYYKSALGNDTLKAIACYDKIIEFSPTNPVGYDGKANLQRDNNPEGAEATLNAAKQQIPTFPINVRLARLYDYRYNLYLLGRKRFDAEDINKVVKHVELAERDSMSSEDYHSFSNWFFVAADNSKNTDYNLNGFNLAKEGIERYPDATRLNQVAMFNAVARGLYKDAVPYGEKFIASGDSLVDGQAYYYMERAYYGSHDYNKCIQTCEELLSRPDAKDDQRATAIRHMASSYKELGEYEKADNVYADYINKRKADGALNFADLFAYASMFKDKAEESNGQEKMDAYRRAYDLMGEAAPLDASQAYWAYYQQMFISETIDPDYKDLLIIKPGQSAYAILCAKSELDPTEQSVFEYTCNKLGYYYTFIKKDKNKGIAYWKKLHEINPENPNALKVLKMYKII